MHKKNTAFLLTCHNRKTSTLNCIQTIHDCASYYNKLFDIFLVDDNSTDGTVESINSMKNPNVHTYLILADGHQYWGGGMSLAYKRLLESTCSYDLICLINDDILIAPEKLNQFLENSIIINSYDNRTAFTCASFTDKNDQISYGGINFASRIPISTERVSPLKDSFLKCDVCNFNLVSIRPHVLHKIGFIPWFTPHQRGDFFVSRKAVTSNFVNYVAPGFYGICNRNPSLKEQIIRKKASKLSAVSGLFSAKKYPLPHTLIYSYRMFGVFGVFSFVIKITKDLFCIVIDK